MMLLDWMMNEDYSKSLRDPDNVMNSDIGRPHRPTGRQRTKRRRSISLW